MTGNTGIDALRYTVRLDYAHPVLDWAADSRLVLMTAHRRENLGEPMRNMFRAVRQVLEEQPGVKIVYPIHKILPFGKSPVKSSAITRAFG